MRAQLIDNRVIGSFRCFVVSLASRAADFIPCALKRNAAAHQAAQLCEMFVRVFYDQHVASTGATMFARGFAPAWRIPGILRDLLPIPGQFGHRHDDAPVVMASIAAPNGVEGQPCESRSNARFKTSRAQPY